MSYPLAVRLESSFGTAMLLNLRSASTACEKRGLAVVKLNFGDFRVLRIFSSLQFHQPLADSRAKRFDGEPAVPVWKTFKFSETCLKKVSCSREV